MEQNSNILVTGVNSGLGKYCLQHFSGKGFSRSSSFVDVMREGQAAPYRAIIHCAFNAAPEVAGSQLYSYLNDTILLARKLLQVPHEKFIFISSTDVYPKNGASHSETEEIPLKDAANLYAISKLMAESMVQNEAADFLILRTTALLGEHARKNSLIKILTQENVKLTLAGASTFNYILHSDVAGFIDIALQENLRGIYNLAAASTIALQEVATSYDKRVEFGNYHYVTDEINNEKAKNVMDNFARTSLENIDLYLKDRTLAESSCRAD
jgi:nucleoside-diphosphate-sugar epimerase